MAENSMKPRIRFKGFTDAWEQRKAKTLFISYAEKGYPELPVLSATQDKGMVYRDDTGKNIFHDKNNEISYKRVQPGQFVIHLRSFQGGFAHSNILGITSPAYTIFGFKDDEKQCDLYWKYVFCSSEFVKRLEAVTYGIRDGRSISYDEFLIMKFIVPKYEEQVQIASILIEIDNLITLHQRKQKCKFLSFPTSKAGLFLANSWEQRKLGGEAEELLAGGDIDKDLICESGRYPVIANALTNDGIVGFYEKYYRVEAPAVTVTGRGDVGHAQARRVNFTPVVRLLSIKSRHNVDFLENAINRGEVIIESTGVPQLTVPQLSKRTISFPQTVQEEEKIGKLFFKIDNLITLHQRKYDKIVNIKKALLEKMFPAEGEEVPKIRFKGFTEAWEQRELGEVANIQKGQQLGKAEMSVVGAFYVLNGGMEPSGYTSQCNTPANTISISEGGNSCGYVSLNLEQFWSGGHNYTLQNPKIDTVFLYQWLKRHEKGIMSLRVGSGLPNIQKTSLKEVDVLYPANAEQLVIAKFLIQLDNLITLHQRQLEKLKNIKAALLEKMFV